MHNKVNERLLAVAVTFSLILLLLAGCNGEPSDIAFSGVWDYPAYDVRLQIFDDNTWEMLDDTGTAVAGGDCAIDGDTAELYYTNGSPWENEDGPVLYNVLIYKKKGELSDGVSYELFLTDETPSSHRDTK